MTNPTDDLLSAFDGHDLEAVRVALAGGADPRAPVRGKPPVVWLLQEYTRSDRLADCVRLLLERGAALPDPLVSPVLLNDAGAVTEAVRARPSLLEHRTTLASAFTSLAGVSFLHVAAEYGHFDAARALVEAGADVNVRAEVDDHGLNGHTPLFPGLAHYVFPWKSRLSESVAWFLLMNQGKNAWETRKQGVYSAPALPLFHTVNSIHNHSEPIMRLLLAAGAKTDVRLAGITWGKGYEWETTFFDVTPISYAQLGLLPQVHRNERDIYSNLRCLLEASGRSVPPLDNVPNRYLRPK